MIAEVLKFLFIWSVILICLSSVACLVFGELQEYSKLSNVVLILFQAGLGEIDFEPFSNLTIGKIYGEIFLVFVVIINCIVLLNFIIAILAATYSKLSESSLGIYYDGIIARIPIYEDDIRYGSLIVGSPPFNFLSIILVPFFCCIKNEERLKTINNAFTMLMFFPLALLLTIAFMVMNIVMLPFAYLTAIYWKF